MLRDLAITRPVTRCVAFTSGPGSGLRTVAANAIGDICLLDFRVPHTSLTSGDADSNSKMTSKSVGSRAAVPPKKVQTFVPAAGAVSGLMCGGAGCANSSHVSINAGINDQPVVIASSLDRFFRVYNRDSGELLAKVSPHLRLLFNSIRAPRKPTVQSIGLGITPFKSYFDLYVRGARLKTRWNLALLAFLFQFTSLEDHIL